MVTFAEHPVPCWYLSHVGAMGPRLPVASAFHPVLSALGRKCPYWLVAAVIGDIVRPPAGGLHPLEPATEREVAELVEPFGLIGTAFRLPEADSLESVREAVPESIRASRPALVRWQGGRSGWWFPLIGHDEGCRHVLARTWGQRHHEFTTLGLETFRGVSDLRFCLFTPAAPLGSPAELARKGLERIATLLRKGDPMEPEATATVAAHLGLAEALTSLSPSEAGDPDVVDSIAANVECSYNAKREARAFFSTVSRWLPAQADRLEKAAYYYDRLARLFRPAAEDFTGADHAAAMLKRPEKRTALAETYRAAARIEARAVRLLEDII